MSRVERIEVPVVVPLAPPRRIVPHPDNIMVMRPRVAHPVHGIALAQAECYLCHWDAAVRHSRGCTQREDCWGCPRRGNLPRLRWWFLGVRAEGSQHRYVLEISQSAHDTCPALVRDLPLRGRRVSVERAGPRPNSRAQATASEVLVPSDALPPAFALLPVLMRLWGYELSPTGGEGGGT